MKILKISLITLIILLPLLIEAQYYRDRPLEMSFEQSGFFFNPSFVNPLGAQHFGEASVLTSNQPLAALQRNPANLSNFDRDSLPSNYLYLDFGNSRRIVSNRYGGIYPDLYGYKAGYSMPGYGYYHTSSRSELSPLMSAAYLTRLPFFNKSVSLAATYQVITQGESYYAIPQDIYRNLAGKSVDGMTYAGMENYQITDRFSGSDEMYHEGHAINVFMAWQLNDALVLGLKTGRVIFEREGSLGSSNLWAQQVDYQSYWKSDENRSQDYDHWDFSLGVTYTANNKNRFGLYAGLLTGNAKQLLARDDESMSQSGKAGTSRWSDYKSWYVSDQKWDHKGRNLYTGFQWEKQIRDDLSFRFIYNYSYLLQDLGLKSSIETESENEYYYQASNYLSESNGFSKMHDFRTGDGERTISNNSIKAAFKWKLRPNQNLSLGAILGSRQQSTKTSEKVDSFSETYYFWNYVYNTNANTSEYRCKSIEDKTIQWEFTSRLRSIQIPVIYENVINKRLGFLIGINRTMNFWKIENSTLVLYDYRERVQNNQTLIERMTGERITEPRERLSIVNTNILGGLTISPSELFTFQLVVSPGFEKNSLLNEYRTGLQGWLGMTMRF